MSYHDFSNGVEYGMLYMRLKRGEEQRVAEYVDQANVARLTELAPKHGYTVVEATPSGTSSVYLVLEKD